MQTQWYQIWAEVPYIGRQWVGWLNTDPTRASLVAMGLQSCAGAKLTILDQNGQPVPTVGGGTGMPDIGQILGTLGNWGK